MKFLLSLYLFFVSFSLFAQLDTTAVMSLNRKAQFAIQDQNWQQATQYAIQALELAQKTNYVNGKIEALFALAQTAKQQNKVELAASYYLTMLPLQEKKQDLSGQASTLEQLADLYALQSNYGKAVANYKNALTLQQKLANSTPHQLRLNNKIGQAYFAQQDYPNATPYYQYNYQQAKKQQDTPLLIANLQKLAYLAVYQQNYSQALAYNTELIEKLNTIGDTAALVNVYNNLGYIYKQTKQPNRAYSYLNQALSLQKKQYAQSSNQAQKLTLLTNIGVIYTTLNDAENAEATFNDALKIAEDLGAGQTTAEIFNYKAVNHWLAKDYEAALEDALRALEISLQGNWKKQQRDAYKVLADVYQAQKNYKKAQAYFQLFSETNTAIASQATQQQQALLKSQVEQEKKESETKLASAESQRQELLFRQLQLEDEKKAQTLTLQQKELDLLKRSQDLQAIALKNQKLEQIRIERELEITKQKLTAEAQNKQMQALQTERELQELAIQRQKDREKRQKDSIDYLRIQTTLQQDKINQEEKTQKYSYAVIAVSLLALLITIYALWQNKRKNAVLAQQTLRIQQQNEELKTNEEEIRQNLEEMTTISETLRLTNENMTITQQELEKRNQDITASINYAKRIQLAILPTDKNFKAIFPESFVFFQPRDIVSGDFYWCTRKYGKLVIAVADCTGHGVPGGFMSMIGNQLLEKAVNSLGIVSPDFILYEMHLDIRRTLQQADEEAQQDGMDVAVCTFDLKDNLLEYAGAMNPLWYTKDGKFNEIKATRKPVGGRQPEQERLFEKHKIVIEAPTTLYLCTDGFQDQMGGKDNKKFLTKNFKELIALNQHKTLEEQKTLLENTFNEWKGEQKQVDDVCIIGIQLKPNPPKIS